TNKVCNDEALKCVTNTRASCEAAKNIPPPKPPGPLQCIECKGAGQAPICYGTDVNNGFATKKAAPEACTSAPFPICPAVGIGWSDAPGPFGCDPRTVPGAG